MYAVIEVGGKQYIVKEGDTIEVERQDAQEGKDITLKNVLLAFKNKKIEIGQPYLKDAHVEAKVLEHKRGVKVISYKYRRRKSSHWKKGHRQELTVLKIKELKIN
jgi:large subunit ribosomal protein L21